MTKLIVLAAALLFAGCGAQQFTANTSASAGKGGFNYSSNKNQENLKATGEQAADGSFKFSVETNASTPESAIAAAANAQAAATKAMSDILGAILPLMQTAVQGAALANGVPLPKPAPKPATPAPALAVPPLVTP